MSTGKRPPFTSIDNRFFYELFRYLRGQAMEVYANLCCAARQREEMDDFPLEILSDRAHLSDKALTRALRQLEHYGFIATRRTQNGYVYSLPPFEDVRAHCLAIVAEEETEANRALLASQSSNTRNENRTFHDWETDLPRLPVVECATASIREDGEELKDLESRDSAEGLRHHPETHYLDPFEEETTVTIPDREPALVGALAAASSADREGSGTTSIPSPRVRTPSLRLIQPTPQPPSLPAVSIEPVAEKAPRKPPEKKASTKRSRAKREPLVEGLDRAPYYDAFFAATGWRSQDLDRNGASALNTVLSILASKGITPERIADVVAEERAYNHWKYRDDPHYVLNVFDLPKMIVRLAVQERKQAVEVNVDKLPGESEHDYFKRVHNVILPEAYDDL